MVYAFAGPTRYCNIAHYLKLFMPGIRLVELDILRDETHDLTREGVWTRLFALVQKPKTIFVTTPPCHTFSRARHRKPGPPPLRSVDWPKGFPWLSEKHFQEVESFNYFSAQSVQASYLGHSVGNPYLWEHPEDLGKAADDLIPATIWQWTEILDLLLAAGAQCFAFYQCQFEAPYPKPTRVLTALPYKPQAAVLRRAIIFQDRRFCGATPRSMRPWRQSRASHRRRSSHRCLEDSPRQPVIHQPCKWLAETIAASSFHDLGPSLQAKGREGSDLQQQPRGSALPPFPQFRFRFSP